MNKEEKILNLEFELTKSHTKRKRKRIKDKIRTLKRGGRY